MDSRIGWGVETGGSGVYQAGDDQGGEGDGEESEEKKGVG
jgi:hypothetical protein